MPTVEWNNAQGRWRLVSAYDPVTNTYPAIIEDDSGNTSYLGRYDSRDAVERAFICRMTLQNYVMQSYSEG